VIFGLGVFLSLLSLAFGDDTRVGLLNIGLNLVGSSEHNHFCWLTLLSCFFQAISIFTFGWVQLFLYFAKPNCCLILNNKIVPVETLSIKRTHSEQVTIKRHSPTKQDSQVIRNERKDDINLTVASSS
jgi:hypothetical protein